MQAMNSVRTMLVTLKMVGEATLQVVRAAHRYTWSGRLSRTMSRMVRDEEARKCMNHLLYHLDILE